MADRRPQRRREFGSVRQLPSGRWQARYRAPDGSRRTAPKTFDTKTDAQTWLTLTQADIERKDRVDPDAGAVNFAAYALTWSKSAASPPPRMSCTADSCGCTACPLRPQEPGRDHAAWRPHLAG